MLRPTVSLSLSLSLSLSVVLRPTVSQPVCLGTKHPLGLTARSLLLSDSCGFLMSGGLSDEGRVCRLQLLLVLASAVILGSESRGTRDHILLSQIRGFLSDLLPSNGCPFTVESVTSEMCLPNRCLVMVYFGFQSSCHNMYVYIALL
jgi:hypothetical protein